MTIKNPEHVNFYENPDHWEARTFVCQPKNGDALQYVVGVLFYV